jgi:hypothetical protein
MSAIGVPYIQTPTYIAFKNARILLRCVSVDVALVFNAIVLFLQHFPCAHCMQVSPHVHPCAHVQEPELHFSHEHPSSHVLMSTKTHTFIKKPKKSADSESLHISAADTITNYHAATHTRSIYVKLHTDMNAQTSAPAQALINDVCEYLQEYLHACDPHMPMLTLQYIQNIQNEAAIVAIVSEMLGDARHLTDDKEILASPDAQNIVQVWRAVKQSDQNTIQLIKDEIMRLRRQCLLPPGPTPPRSLRPTGPEIDLENRRPSSIGGPTLARMRALLAVFSST